MQTREKGKEWDDTTLIEIKDQTLMPLAGQLCRVMGILTVSSPARIWISLEFFAFFFAMQGLVIKSIESKTNLKGVYPAGTTYLQRSYNVFNIQII